MSINCVEITSSHAVCCPTCDRPVFLVFPDREQVPDGSYWLEDGDTVGEVWDALSETQRTPDGFFYELMTGNCGDCSAPYYAVTASFMDTSFDTAEQYLCFNVELGPARNRICRCTDTVDGIPPTWLVQVFSTAIGPMTHHIFGPWLLQDTVGVLGPYGVSRCGHDEMVKPWDHARNLLLHLWDELKDFRPVNSDQAMPQVRQP